MKPCWSGYMADPMVLKTSAGFYAFGTDGPEGFARAESGREFPLLKSDDLIEWEFVSGALTIPQGKERLAFWAPEVAEREGRFFLYYSAGGPEGEGHAIRVAVADHPQGPFTTEDRSLLPEEPFTIDAHPFRDPADGKWYLFFAKDFFEEPTGTGIACVPLSDDMMSIEGEVNPLLRGLADWQIFDRNRNWYDRIWPTWFCVEGPFVVYRLRRYWMFYSGGNWHAHNYGVGCAVSHSVLGPYVDVHVDHGPSVLTTSNGLRGPGHCSIVVDDKGSDHICFHAWDSNYTARRMHIAALAWNDGGPRLT